MTKFSKLFDPHNAFPTQVGVLLVVWIVYRTFAHLPIWFDEIVAKAVIFGLPAMLYARNIQKGQDTLGLSRARFWHGMFFGLLVGGLYGFVGVLRTLVRGVPVEPVALFIAPRFWYEFFLATMTAWWESIFFFGYILGGLKDQRKLPEVLAIMVATLVFVAFHAPLRILVEGFHPVLFEQLALLAIFAIGQSILFLRTRSIYAVTISHALWGMVLLVYV